MFNREPNIDVVFRNGLKNLEVLPPADVWDSIPPMPARLRRTRTIMGIAAGIAALLTLTLFASLYFRNNNILSPGPELALAPDGDLPVTVTPSLTSASALPVEIATSRNTSGSTSSLPVHETVIPGTDGTPVTSSVVPDLAQSETSGHSDGPLPFPGDEITVIASGLLTGQDNLTAQLPATVRAENTEQRFLIGASLSPSMGFSPTGQNERLVELMNGETSKPSYTTGLTFGYKISSRLTIQSGIGLASIGQTINGVDVFAGLSDFYAVKSDYLYSVQTASGTIHAGNTDLYLADSQNRVASLVSGNMADPSKYDLTQVGNNIQQVFRYLELPVVLRYKVIDRKVGLNLTGGLAYGYMVDNFAYTKNGADLIPVGYTDGVNVHSLSSQVGLGMEYNISSKLSFNFEPVFKYYVTPVSEFSGELYKPYSVGFFSGLFFKF